MHSIKHIQMCMLVCTPENFQHFDEEHFEVFQEARIFLIKHNLSSVFFSLFRYSSPASRFSSYLISYLLCLPTRQSSFSICAKAFLLLHALYCTITFCLWHGNQPQSGVDGDLAESIKGSASNRLCDLVQHGSSPDFSRVFLRHGASWPLSRKFLSMYYCRTQANLCPFIRFKIIPAAGDQS